MCLPHEICCTPRENKGFGNRLQVNFVPKKTKRQLSISDSKMLLLTGNIGKAYKVRNLLCTHD